MFKPTSDTTSTGVLVYGRVHVNAAHERTRLQRDAAGRWILWDRPRPGSTDTGSGKGMIIETDVHDEQRDMRIMNSFQTRPPAADMFFIMEGKDMKRGLSWRAPVFGSLEIEETPWHYLNTL